VSAAAILDAMEEHGAREALARCCGAERWVDAMIARRPFGNDDALFRAAGEAWAAMEEGDILEAFAHHPRIGADLASLRARFAPTKEWSAGEQAGVTSAGEQTLLALRDGNASYEARFGYIFIVCATGKSADEMLALLKARMNNTPDDELRIAAAEQAKIIEIRLSKLGGETSHREAMALVDGPHRASDGSSPKGSDSGGGPHGIHSRGGRGSKSPSGRGET
jgi:2-oxo-4-hydroxy-4-carboxy-5-ureidoimidazoline decarboxylase